MADDVKHTKSKFWWGLLFGLFLYPLIVPWVVRFAPEAMFWYLEHVFGSYMDFVFRITGQPF